MPFEKAVALAIAEAQVVIEGIPVPREVRETSGEAELLLCGEAETAGVREPSVGLALIGPLREVEADTVALLAAEGKVEKDADAVVPEEAVGLLAVGAMVNVSVG